MAKSYIYARVSTREQSLELQLNEIKKYCDFRNIEVVGIYEDKMSGKNTDREGFKRLVHDLKINPHGVDSIVVYKLDRIGRSIRDLISFTDFLQNKEIGLIAISNNIDTTTKEGRLFFYMMSAIAEYERELILERVTLGREAAIEKGVKMGAPYKDAPANIIKEMVACGMTKTAIAKKFNISRATVYERLKE